MLLLILKFLDLTRADSFCPTVPHLCATLTTAVCVFGHWVYIVFCCNIYSRQARWKGWPFSRLVVFVAVFPNRSHQCGFRCGAYDRRRHAGSWLCWKGSNSCEQMVCFSLSLLSQAEEDDDMGVSDSQAAMLEAKVDPVEWKRELERVGPKLKVRE